MHTQFGRSYRKAGGADLEKATKETVVCLKIYRIGNLGY